MSEYIDEVLGKIESFDSFFAGLSAKEEPVATRLYLQYVIGNFTKALQDHEEALKKDLAAKIEHVRVKWTKPMILKTAVSEQTAEIFDEITNHVLNDLLLQTNHPKE